MRSGRIKGQCGKVTIGYGFMKDKMKVERGQNECCFNL